jgi:methionyl-tRNA formyltransferase
MEKAIDAGAIIGQHSFPISVGDDWHSMEVKINEILRATFLSDLKRYISGDIKPAAQDIRIRSNTGKYYEYMKIDWNKENGKAIYNKINLYPFLVPTDYCFTLLNARKIVIKKAAFINSQAALLQFGQFHLQGLTLLIQANSGIIACKLFYGLGVMDSILFVLKRRGNFT